MKTLVVNYMIRGWICLRPHELTIIEQGYSYTAMQYLAIVSSYLHKQGCEYVTITFTL